MKRGAVTPGYGYAEQKDRPRIGWALLGALSVSAIVSVSIIGCSLILGKNAAAAAGVIFFILWPTLTIAGIAISVLAWGGPVRLAKIQHAEATTKTIYKDRPILVNQRGQRGPTIGEKMAAMLDRIKKRADEGLEPQLYKAPRYQSQAQQPGMLIESPKIDEQPFWKEVFETTNTMWTKPLTRASFDEEYVGGQKTMYPKYKDLWTRLGWVSTDGRGTMTWVYDNRDAMYRRIPELRKMWGAHSPTLLTD